MRKTCLALSLLILTGCASRPVNTHGSEPSEEPVLPGNGDSTYINEELDYFLNDGDELPKGYEWSVVSGDAKIIDGCLHKTESSDEYEQIVLSAKDSTGTYELERLLLDTWSGYIISYFSEKGDEAERMKLAYTFDCKYWFKLYEDKAVLSAESGTKRLRDPALFRKPDGTFGVTATQGYDTDSIYVFDSPDLITFENERLLKVNASTEDAKLSEEQAWAPEIFWDHTIGRYVILWSSVKDGSMFFNTSSDLNAFSYPQKLELTDHPVIDGTVVKDGHQWLICAKDEREPMEEHSQLFFGFSDTSWNDWQTVSGPVTGHQSEGPMIMKDLEGPGWYLYYDDYTRFQFKALYLSGLEDPSIREIEDSELLIPLDAPAHSYALPVTWKEMERIQNAYGT